MTNVDFESPTQLARALRLLPTMKWFPGTGLTLRLSWEPSPLGVSVVAVVAGRAT
jgi:hypothetical protein